MTQDPEGIVFRNDTYLEGGEQYNMPPLLTTFVVVEPGNCTRYRVAFTRPDFDGAGVQGVLVTWLKDISHGPSMVVSENSFVHVDYVAEKLGCGLGDARPLTKIIGAILGLPTSEDAHGQ